MLAPRAPLTLSLTPSSTTKLPSWVEPWQPSLVGGSAYWTLVVCSTGVTSSWLRWLEWSRSDYWSSLIHRSAFSQLIKATTPLVSAASNNNPFFKYLAVKHQYVVLNLFLSHSLLSPLSLPQVRGIPPSLLPGATNQSCTLLSQSNCTNRCQW